MEDLYAECKVKAIGICNFTPDRFVDFSHFVKVQPQINQVKTHVFFQQRELRKYMDKYNTQIMAWAPLAEGKHDFFKNETLKSIGQKYGKTIAQTALRYAIQDGIVVIPKSVHKERIEENETIKRSDVNIRTNPPYTNPEITEFLINYKWGDEINLPNNNEK